MLDIFNKWYKRYLFEEESVLLLVLLVVAVALLMTIGDILAPVVASIVLAYLMQGLAGRLEQRGLPGWVGVSVAYTLFVGIFFGVTLGLLPLVWRQLVALASEMPRMLEQGRQLLTLLPGRYPDVVSQQQINQMVALAQAELGGLGQQVVTRSLATIPSILTLLVYMILIPILVFFFLKDRQQILSWLATFLPSERPLLRRLWSEMDTQALLALCVGLSVIIPYLGAALVTLPVLLVGFFQWGFTSEFYWLMAVYFVIQGLDGNVLVPLLFSEAVNLHPVAIILAVLFFGGIWGVWGVFFAIPLATLIKAVINAWPTPMEGDNQRSLE